MLNKITRTPFKSAVRESRILDLVHSDLYYFHGTHSLENKRYVIIFADDYSKFLLWVFVTYKDEAVSSFKVQKYNRNTNW